MRRRHVWLVAVGAVVALLASWGVWWAVRRGDGPATADRSSTLEGVVEPIAIVFGMSLDDGGSKSIQFRDARRAERELCLEYHLNWENDPNDSDGHRNLYLGSLFPRGRGSRRLPISGAEERALLGILERWARADEEASEIDRRYALLERGELEVDAFWEGLRDEHRVKGIAVSILRELRRRNGAASGRVGSIGRHRGRR